MTDVRAEIASAIEAAGPVDAQAGPAKKNYTERLSVYNHTGETGPWVTDGRLAAKCYNLHCLAGEGECFGVLSG